MNNAKLAMTIEEACECTGIGQNTLRQLIRWETIPVLRVGRKTLIRTDTLTDFLAANQGIDLRDRQAVRSITGRVS